MPGPEYQVGAAVPLRIAPGLGDVSALVQEDGVPEPYAPALIEREGEARLRRLDVGGWHTCHEIGVERLDIPIIHAGERGIGHGRVEMVAILRHALAHGAIEVG